MGHALARACERAGRGGTPLNETVERFSVITCPQCGTARREEMPTDACQFFYECTGCKTLLKPQSGDCCVFCSYGSVKCPPQQLDQGCCG